MQLRDLSWLENLIAVARQRLNELGKQHRLTSSVMIRKSQQLDRFLNWYQRCYVQQKQKKPIAGTIDFSEA
jgi:hypothetical protein